MNTRYAFQVMFAIIVGVTMTMTKTYSIISLPNKLFISERIYPKPIVHHG
jgi:hypothetical protein